VATVTVVVPTLAAARAERLVRSLAAQTLPHQLILVDNDSPEEARMHGLRRRHPAIEILRLPENAGYSRAVNIGVDRAEGEVVVLVNDDCELEPTFLEALTAVVDPHAGVTMGAGVMRDARRPELVETAGIQVDSTLFAFDYLNGEPLAALAAAPPPFGPSAAAAAILRDAFRDAGGFDEALFAYLEDVDLAVRLRAAGGACALAADALGTHEHSATLGAGSASKDYLMGYGRGYLLRKWSVATPRRLPGIVLREAVICAGQAVFDRNLAGVRGRIRGFRAASRSNPYPAEAIAAGQGDRVTQALWHRARRRARLRGSVRGRPADDGDS
jgi:N-acetylglucosaminyl-diphospho-decaprenol L-rhamnosyltransferase